MLVTGGDYVGPLAALRALREAGYEPWVTVFGPRAYAARSRAAAGVVVVPDPAGDPDGFVEKVADAAAHLSVAAVLPGTEKALVAVAGRADRFPPGVALGVCPPAAVERATDKALLVRLAGAAGLDAPPTRVATLSGAWAEDLDHPLPAVVKPLRSDTETGDGRLRHSSARKVESLAELHRALAALPEQRGLVQPFLPGRLTALAGVFWNGEVVAAVRQRAYRLWPSDCGEMAYAETIPREDRLERAVGRLLELIGWEGIFQVQFIEHRGRRCLIDLNPRIYGSLALALGAGQNLIGIWTDLLLGRTPGVDGYRTGIRFRREELDVRAIGSAIVKGQLGSAVAGILPRRRTVHAIFDRTDPMPIGAALWVLLDRITGGPSTSL